MKKHLNPLIIIAYAVLTAAIAFNAYNNPKYPGNHAAYNGFIGVALTVCVAINSYLARKRTGEARHSFVSKSMMVIGLAFIVSGFVFIPFQEFVSKRLLEYGLLFFAIGLVYMSIRRFVIKKQKV